MRDGINLAKLGMPAVSLVTDEFWPQGDFVAESLGMPDAPRIMLPHPVAGSGVANMRKVAQDIAAQIVDALEGSSD